MPCTILASCCLSATTTKTLTSSKPRPSTLLPAGRPRQQRQRVAVRAAAQPDDGSGSPVTAMQSLARNAERVLSRYDFLSAGMGAMVVTGFCVARGQDVGTALWITAAASVVAILVNDILPGEH